MTPEDRQDRRRWYSDARRQSCHPKAEADSLSDAEQLDFSYQLIAVAARSRQRVEQKPFNNPGLIAGDTPWPAESS